jgi:phage tail protein X
VPPFVPDATYISLGQPKSPRIYVSTQGDWWDLIAIRVYGRVRGNEHLMFRLLEANYALREVCNFPAGVAVIVPDVPIVNEIPLVPWKAATAIPSSLPP